MSANAVTQPPAVFAANAYHDERYAKLERRYAAAKRKITALTEASERRDLQHHATKQELEHARATIDMLQRHAAQAADRAGVERAHYVQTLDHMKSTHLGHLRNAQRDRELLIEENELLRTTAKRSKKASVLEAMITQAEAVMHGEESSEVY